MKNYGLTEYQRDKALKKLKFNKKFMATNGIQLDDKLVPFADFVTNSYINSDRYIAELQHRAWSVFDYAKERDLKNVFFTLTLPSKWHSMKQKSKKDKTMIFNKKFAGRKYIKVTTKSKLKYDFINAHVVQNIPFIEPDFDFTNTIERYTPRNASKELSKLLKKFFDDRAYKNVNKEDRCYFRVTEPHKDGTPHIHMSLFVPADSVDSIVKSLKRKFPAPLGKIETNVDSPVSYLMKYVLKTLDDLRDDEDKITNLTLWYLYHGISRFYTSRTFISLEAYRKLNGNYTLADLTKAYLREDVSIYTDTTTKKIVLIENEFGTLYTPKPVNWYDKLIDTDHTYYETQFEPIYKEDEETFVIPDSYYLDGKKYAECKDGWYREQKKSPLQMKDFELREYYNKLDINEANEGHYTIVHNEMIKRELLVGEWLKPLEMYEAGEVF